MATEKKFWHLSSEIKSQNPEKSSHNSDVWSQNCDFWPKWLASVSQSSKWRSLSRHLCPFIQSLFFLLHFLSLKICPQASTIGCTSSDMFVYSKFTHGIAGFYGILCTFCWNLNVPEWNGFVWGVCCSCRVAGHHTQTDPTCYASRFSSVCVQSLWFLKSSYNSRIVPFEPDLMSQNFKYL